MSYGAPFKAIGHIPKYSKVFIKALRTPLLLYMAALGNLLLIASAICFFHLENPSNPSVTTFFDAIWWSFATVSTVGFGDITPVTTGGRVVGIFLMVTGVTLFVGFTAVFVSVISSLTAKDIVQGEELTYQEYKEVLSELKRLHSRLDQLEKK